MKIWIQKSSIFLFAGFLYGVGQFFASPQWFGYCQARPYESSLCLADTAVGTGWPLIAAGQILAIAGLILLFANREGLRKWLWMSAVYLPLGALIVLNIPTESHAWAISLTPSREHATWLLGYLYILTTLLIVLWGWWKGKHSRPI
ncbi:MAG: hypothetical protein Q7S95_00310 [bacterium]|nr:hypothetical protein [bacterium]